VQLEQADRAHCNRLSFEVAPNSDFGELARNLTADGITSELRNDCVPGMGQVLTFRTTRARHRPVQGMELPRLASPGQRHRAAQARPRRVPLS